MINKHKQAMIEIGKLLWDKDLVSACSGNISVKADEKTIFITIHEACLGMLTEDDIVSIDKEGRTNSKKSITTEKPIHLAVHKEFSQSAVLHVHPPWTNGYCAVHDSLNCITHESKLMLGDVPNVPQETPSITNIEKVIDALKKSNIVVLKNHGVIAIGRSLRDAFFLIQALEEAVKVAVIAQFYGKKEAGIQKKTEAIEIIPRYKMFSDEHIKVIVGLVNSSEEFLAQAKALALRTTLAVKMDETGKTFCFTFEDGKITNIVPSDAGAEFVISGSSEHWRKIFNRELDPFVATTQKKLTLKGDFGKISRWYAPFNKLFELWRKVGVE